MKIITFQGGLGNQMFQYVYYQYLRSQYPEETFYGFYPKLALKDHNGLEINKWFEVDLPNTCLSSDIISNFLFWVNKFIRKLRLKYPFTDTDWFRRPNALFYFGYWQNKEYFLFTGILKFKINVTIGNDNERILKDIIDNNSVVVHVRRGDYETSAKARKIYGGICTIEYYKKALKIILDKVDKPKFFFFSDNVDYVNEYFDDVEKTVISWNKGERSFFEMYLMAHGKNMIIANSTFSCWAAYLNKNNPIVICPQIWRNDRPSPPVVLDNWITISNR